MSTRPKKTEDLPQPEPPSTTVPEPEEDLPQPEPPSITVPEPEKETTPVEPAPTVEPVPAALEIDSLLGAKVIESQPAISNDCKICGYPPRHDPYGNQICPMAHDRCPNI